MKPLSRSLRAGAVAMLLAGAIATPAVAAEPAPPNEQMQALLDQLAALGGEPIDTLEPAEARNQPSVADAVAALLQSRGESTAPEPVGDVEDRTIPGPASDLPVRIYTPEGEGPFPVIVYYHGGGFVIATIDTYDSSARALANAAGAIVISLEYRKAPEHPFPAAVDDAYAAYLWATENAAEIDGDADRVAVAGESAGGNLATVVSLRARDAGDQLPVHQLLVYPLSSFSLDFPSVETYAEAAPLNKAALEWFGGHYLADPSQATDPDVSPLGAPDLSGLPPATIIAAQIDPLLSEGRDYADALRDAGVSVSYRRYDGVTHEFFGTGAVVDEGTQAVTFAGQRLADAFADLPDTFTAATEEASPFHSWSMLGFLLLAAAALLLAVLRPLSPLRTRR
ncbi:MAG: alpha/beta hydrolase [Chloroflexota bacterium]|nr:alpha/beta hydrolase [Chloroflexota bacterium]